MKRTIGKLAYKLTKRISPETIEQHNIGMRMSFAKELGLHPINESRASDVFVVGWPKSGNTWMQRIVSSLAYGVQGESLNDHLCQLLVPDVHHQKFYHRLGPTSYFKSHHLPQPQMQKVVHIVRDGRDALVSYRAMLEKLGNNVSLKEMATSGAECYPCMWVEHCKEWLRNPYSADIHPIKYEDLLNSTYDELLKLCDFMKITISPSRVEQVIKDTSLQAMKKIETDSGWANPGLPNGKSFFRQGKTHTYTQELKGELLNNYENLSYDMLKYYSYI